MLDCAVDHSFGTESTRVIWIIIKDDTLIQDRIQSATTDPNTSELSLFQTIEDAFASTLMTHLLMRDWACENWDQYLVFIEAHFHELTKGVLSNDMDIQPNIIREFRNHAFLKQRRTGTAMSARSFHLIIEPLIKAASRVRKRDWRHREGIKYGRA